MDNYKVLVFPCGTEIALELWRALKDIRFIELYGASGAEDHGRYVFSRYFGGVPFVTDPAFVDHLNTICRENDIDYIFPAHDDVQLALVKNQSRLCAKVVAPCPETVELCRHKALTYRHLEGEDYVPRVYSSPEEVERFPVIVKPDAGQGSQGVVKLSDLTSLTATLAQLDKPQVIVEYLSGEEYTVDCFTDRHGRLLYCAFRERLRIRNGISVCSRLMPPDPRVTQIAHSINKRMKHRGVWFFQLKKNDAGDYRLLEVATRVAGTMCVERIAGVNLPLLTLFDMMDMDVRVEPQLSTVEVERALTNRYTAYPDFDEVYIDFDDTLVVHGRVNLSAISLIYQCVDRGIPVHLLTRHEGDLDSALTAHRISRALFDSVVHVPAGAKKSAYITPSPRAVFIDDSFAERADICAAFGIKTFGVDSIEGLIDWRS